MKAFRLLCLCVFCLLLLGSFGAQAQEKTTVGAACTTGQSAADWDTIMQCVGGVWKRAPLWVGTTTAACDASHAGVVQLYNGKIAGCDGTNWINLQDGSVVQDAYTKLLLHFENNANDSSASARSPSANTATFSNTTYKLGGYSAYYNGSASTSYASSTDFDFGSGDFTIDFWFKRARTATGEYLTTRSGDINNASTAFQIGFQDGAQVYAYFRYSDGTTAGTANFTVNDTNWHHLAIVRNGANAITTYLDGVAGANVLNPAGKTINPSTYPLVIGMFGGGGWQFQGYIDEFRVSKGIARWTSNFTPPTAPY